MLSDKMLLVNYILLANDADNTMLSVDNMVSLMASDNMFYTNNTNNTNTNKNGISW
jgi:hypothetical protein